MANDRIVIRGAREHNLKSIDLEDPARTTVVITGSRDQASPRSPSTPSTPRGSGATSSRSPPTRGSSSSRWRSPTWTPSRASPAISIEQKTTSKNPRSTVGTVTEIYDYLRVLFARVGVPHCPQCGKPISAQTVQQMVDRVLALPAGSRLLVLAPVIRGRKGEYRKLFFDLKRQGYVRVRVNGQIRELSEEIELAKTKKHTIEVVVDRIILRDTVGTRLADSLETALRLAEGFVQVEVVDGPAMLFSERLACAACGISSPEVSPRMFSFNNPYGACPECGGIGTRYEVDPACVVPDGRRALGQGALAPWVGQAGGYFKQTLQVLARRHRFNLDTPWDTLSKKTRDLILHGEPDGGFEGALTMLDRRYRETLSEEARREVERFMTLQDCPACRGSRLRPEALAVKIGGRSIAEVVRLPIKAAADLRLARPVGARGGHRAARAQEIRERRASSPPGSTTYARPWSGHPVRGGAAHPSRDPDRPASWACSTS